MIKIALITLFPEMFEALTRYGITRRAFDQGYIDVKFFNPRDFTEDKHQTVDDRPYGGGPGMVMLPEPLSATISAAKQWSDSPELPAKVIYMSPQGACLDQQKAGALAAEQRNLVIIAGRYEGIDQRIIDRYVDEEISIGDYVVSGGELPAMILMDSLIRLLPGVLGDSQSAEQDSFIAGLLDWPHYTRPEIFEQTRVPDVLLSGNHQHIAQWRLTQALGKTWLNRPDLLARKKLNAQEEKLLEAFIAEHAAENTADKTDE